MTRIRVAIGGYGNVGRGVEQAVARCPDLTLVAVLTGREPGSVTPKSGAPVVPYNEMAEWLDRIDVLIMCEGSATDLPELGPQLAALFNTVDSFDTHAAIPTYFAQMDAAASAAGKVAVIAVGWDPGLFSLARAFALAALPEGQTHTFWGKGVSQGHSNAIRRIPGVADAIQYTIPVEAAVTAARSGTNPQLAIREKHTRECFVVTHDGADQAHIEKTIVEMPNYFADYHTSVHFISAAELAAEHSAMPHGGFVIRSGTTGDAHTTQVVEYRLQLGSNPEFTGSVLVAYARAAQRLAQAGERGAKTVFDIPPGLLLPQSPAQLREELL